MNAPREMESKYAQYVLGEGTVGRSVRWATDQRNTDVLTVMATTQQQQKVVHRENA